MGVEEVGSRCSLKKPLKFRWFGNPDVPEGQDLAAAISKFEEILEAPNLVQNEYLAILATVEFEKKLKSALLGALYPVTEIDRVGKRHGCPLYEIRWQWINVQFIEPGGNIRDGQIRVRMYHSEPSEVPDHFVGHHVHEKDVSDSNSVNALQDQEILVAVGHYQRGKPTRWGISS